MNTIKIGDSEFDSDDSVDDDVNGEVLYDGGAGIDGTIERSDIAIDDEAVGIVPDNYYGDTATVDNNAEDDQVNAFEDTATVADNAEDNQFNALEDTTTVDDNGEDDRVNALEDTATVEEDEATDPVNALEDDECVLECRQIDLHEQQKVEQFLENGCGCSLFNGKPCSAAFSKEHIYSVCDQFTSLDCHNRYSILFGHVMATIRALPTVESRGHPSKERSRVVGEFLHEGIKVKVLVVHVLLFVNFFTGM